MGEGRMRVPCVLAVAILGLLGFPVVANAAELPKGCSTPSGEPTEGADVITCGNILPGDTVDGLGGDDTINITGNIYGGKVGQVTKNAVVRGGDGNDTINIKGDILYLGVVQGGAGNDTINTYDVGQFYCSGKKGETGAVGAPGGSLDGGDGNDTITVGGGTRKKACADLVAQQVPAGIPLGNVSGYGKVLGGAGNDKITVGTVGYTKSNKKIPEQGIEVLGGRVDGGAGMDTIDVGYLSQTAKSSDGVYGGPGNDRMHIGFAAGLGTAYGEGGDDTITLDGAAFGEVQGGDGNDTINATKGQLTFGAVIDGGNGNDRIKVKSMGNSAAIRGGPGDDDIDVGTVNGPDDVLQLNNGATVNGNEGNDTIKVDLVGCYGSVSGDAGDDIITVNSLNGPRDTNRKWDDPKDPWKFHNGLVMGQDGNDKITVGVLGKRGQVWGDGYVGAKVAGQDTIKVTSVNGESAVRGGPLADLITVGTVAAKASVLGEEGPDTITVTGKNLGTVNGGDDKDTCKVQAGAGTVTCEVK